jgi:hypothetical protein
MRSVVSTLVTITVASLSTSVDASIVVFNNFGPNNTFDTDAGYLATGVATSNGPEWSACQFTSTASGVLDKVTIAAGNLSGSNFINVTIHQDVGDMVGDGIIEWSRGPLPPFGGSHAPLVLINPFPSVTLLADTKYWVSVRPDSATTHSIWNHNNQGDLGLRAMTMDQGLDFTYLPSEIRGAMRIEVACPNPGCSADFNGDCSIGLSDLAILLSAFGASAGGDLDGDGDTDLSDLAALLSEYGDDCN